MNRAAAKSSATAPEVMGCRSFALSRRAARSCIGGLVADIAPIVGRLVRLGDWVLPLYSNQKGESTMSK